MIPDRWGTSWVARGALPPELAAVERRELEKRYPLPRCVFYAADSTKSEAQSVAEGELWRGFSSGWSARPRLVT